MTDRLTRWESRDEDGARAVLVKRDLISHLLSLTYRHERDIKDALYTPTPSCSFKEEEGE